MKTSAMNVDGARELTHLRSMFYWGEMETQKNSLLAETLF